VAKADAVCHADTGRSKGWGTVLFETREQAQAAGSNTFTCHTRTQSLTLNQPPVITRN